MRPISPKNGSRQPLASDLPYPTPLFTMALDKKFITPYMQNWNLTLEREVLRSMLLRVGYVGTKGTHLTSLYGKYCSSRAQGRDCQTDQAVISPGHVPVMLQFNAAAPETDGMQRAGEGYAALRHGDIDVVAHGRYFDPQIRGGEGEVSGNIRELVSPGDLSVHHGVGVPDKRVAERGAAAVLIASVARAVDIVRGRVEDIANEPGWYRT